MRVLTLGLALAGGQIPDVSAQRSVPGRPHIQSCRITFNSERIKGFYLFIDARTAQEKERDSALGVTGGPVIVFFQGHAQRPGDACSFTSALAKLSKSGIVIVPVCDTPYGESKDLRGDAGKDVILMEMVRGVLASKGIRVKGYSPLIPDPVLIDGLPPCRGEGDVAASLIPVGWSHGGLLARRFAHAYPGSVEGLGQVCPAGYEYLSPLGLVFRFMGESLRLSRLAACGHTKDTLDSMWGFIRGFVGDLLRSVPAAVSCFMPSKMLRVFKDIEDCSVYCGKNSLCVNSPGPIAVIFGEEDTCMDVGRIMGNPGSEEITARDEEMFWRAFFCHGTGATAGRTIMVLPGRHIAPVTHSDLYARTVLKSLDQLDE